MSKTKENVMIIERIDRRNYKERLAVITGGWSAERERSLLSGQAVLGALHDLGLTADIIDLRDRNELEKRLDGIQTAFLAIAGRGGEDGRLQGYLETRGINYTGSGVLASAVAMHKLRAKTIVESAGVHTLSSTAVDSTPDADDEAARIIRLLGSDVIIKPVNEGCSVGIRLPRGRDELASVLRETADSALMAETYYPGRSVSVAVLEDEDTGWVETLPPIEAVTPGRLYTQAAKQGDDECVYHCPATLPSELGLLLRKQAITAHQALGCHSYSRHDFVVTTDDQALWLEANTLPGLSHKGNLAQMAQAANVDYERLISHILRGANTDRRAHA
ncbi:D-alanine--D-alanine ligase [Streptomyces sp. MBT33]|uniref:D-alanine--D-alanine ligase family protein n=1 Tax=Streptomyces sp. MBT33 TaxID=1488363 RepID=UPI001909C323|nr:D-alanine--D-alanine ligase [Streptomyces sp. MBT33]MBK3639478.1 D-alanine--D-alanine ligase [Streptomyces sp. MBT33]